MKNTIAFLLIRLAIGASMLGHGLARLPKLPVFSGWMVEIFEESILPKELILVFSYSLPVAEFVIGLLLLSGLFTRGAAVAGGLVMVVLIFGTCMIENWEAIPTQLLHIVFFALVLEFATKSNSMALDNIWGK